MTNAYIDCSMEADCIPTYGYSQPRYENQWDVSFFDMEGKKQGTRGTRIVSAPARRMREVFARNLQSLMDRDYPAAHFSTSSERQQKVAADAGVSWSSVQRQLDPDAGKTLDVITDLAVLFNVKPHEMLDPNMSKILGIRTVLGNPQNNSGMKVAL